ncbi:MAG: crossover junction endodeoxyribonuclease RuvC [Rectinemataceae bacterium]|nr:crossover junction endodeoxyribonuclease RuvC [Rectinemataceae bacterium]
MKARQGAGQPQGGPALRIIGIDPGLASIGYGLIDVAGGSMRLLEYGCFTTPSSAAMAQRLCTIHDRIRDLLALWKPAFGGMESLFFFRNVTSALPVAEARGVIRLAFASAEVPLADLSPTAIKQAVTGSARADKAQVQEMVRILLGLPEVPKPDHASDALAAAICRWHNEGPLSR